MHYWHPPIRSLPKILFYNFLIHKIRVFLLFLNYPLIDWLKKYPALKGNIKEIKTAVLWKKKDSTFEPDFCAQKLDSNPWIVQPFEHYEEIRVEDLIKKHQGS